MKPEKITTLFLDIGGVLLTNGWGRDERQNAIDKFGIDKKEMEDRNSLVWSTYELGKLTLEDYLDYVIFYCERPFSREEFKSFMFKQSVALPGGAIEYFKELKKEYEFKVIALSNESRELNDYRIKEYKLNELFDFYISSCYVGLRKPDHDIYKLALNTSQTPAANALYVDDRLPYIEVANRLGIPALHYQGLEVAKEYFRSIGY